MTTEDGLLTRLAVKIRQGVCALHGHDSLLHFDNGRMSLMCFSCGHQSPGWEVGGRGARHQTTASPSRVPHVVRVAYADDRRVA